MMSLDSFLKLQINGANIDNTIINTINVTMSDIPIYMFNKFDITENTSIFNNNYIKLRLRNIPVLGIKTKESIFTPIEEKEDNEIDLGNMTMDNVDFNNDYKQESTEKLTMYIDYENKSNDIVTITTKDCKFYYQENEIENPYPVELPLIKLQEGQKIKMTAMTELGTVYSSMNDTELYSPISIFTFRKVKDNNYEMNLESRGQLTEKEILQFSIIILLNVYKH